MQCSQVNTRHKNAIIWYNKESPSRLYLQNKYSNKEFSNPYKVYNLHLLHLQRDFCNFNQQLYFLLTVPTAGVYLVGIIILSGLSKYYQRIYGFIYGRIFGTWFANYKTTHLSGNCIKSMPPIPSFYKQSKTEFHRRRIPNAYRYLTLLASPRHTEVCLVRRMAHVLFSHRYKGR